MAASASSRTNLAPVLQRDLSVGQPLLSVCLANRQSRCTTGLRRSLPDGRVELMPAVRHAPSTRLAARSGPGISLVSFFLIENEEYQK